jgi:hypothetical protein
MSRRFERWLYRPISRPPRYRRRRAGVRGCLPWLLILIGILVIVSLFFGSFRNGTKASGLRDPGPVPVAMAR